MEHGNTKATLLHSNLSSSQFHNLSELSFLQANYVTSLSHTRQAINPGLFSHQPKVPFTTSASTTCGPPMFGAAAVAQMSPMNLFPHNNRPQFGDTGGLSLSSILNNHAESNFMSRFPTTNNHQPPSHNVVQTPPSAPQQQQQPPPPPPLPLPLDFLNNSYLHTSNSFSCLPEPNPSSSFNPPVTRLHDQQQQQHVISIDSE